METIFDKDFVLTCLVKKKKAEAWQKSHLFSGGSRGGSKGSMEPPFCFSDNTNCQVVTTIPILMQQHRNVYLTLYTYFILNCCQSFIFAQLACALARAKGC